MMRHIPEETVTAIKLDLIRTTMNLKDMAKKHDVSYWFIAKVRDGMTPAERRDLKRQGGDDTAPCNLKYSDWDFCFGVGCRDGLRNKCKAYYLNSEGFHGRRSEENNQERVHCAVH